MPETNAALPLAVLFPGQGAQHARMAAGLYRREPVFTAAMDECFALLDGGELVRADWLAVDPVVPVDDPARAQLLLFAVDYAMGKLVLSWGRQPAALLGHSVGEVAAATVAGVFTLADAISVMVDRMSRLVDAPPGGMLAVAAPAGELAPFLYGDVVVGAVNAPRQTILSGPADELANVRKSLRDRDFTCFPVAAKLPYHSPALAARALAAEPAIARIPLRAPKIPLYSAYRGELLSAEEATRPGFWAGQPAEPVLFWPALNELLASGPHLIVEAGPTGGLATLARQHPTVRTGPGEVVATLLTSRGDPDPDFDLRTTHAAKARITNQQANPPTGM